jgi:hypothetical protein
LVQATALAWYAGKRAMLMLVLLWLVLLWYQAPEPPHYTNAFLSTGLFIYEDFTKGKLWS